MIGFTVDVLVTENNFWSKELMLNIAAGYPIQDAMAYADSAILASPLFSKDRIEDFSISNRLVRRDMSAPFA